MTREEITNNLVKLGLNEREAKLYYSLLQIPEGAASDLQRMSGVPRTKIYEALERLVNQGFVHERVEGRKRFFRAVEPDEVHTEILRRWEAQSRSRESLAGTVFTQLKELSARYEEGKREIDFIEVIRSRTRISQRYTSFVDNSREEILSFVRPPFASAADPEEARRQDIAEDAAMERGVPHRSIYMVGSDADETVMLNLNRRAEGEEARVIDDLPFKMFVFDRVQTLIALPSLPGATGSDFSMIAVKDGDFAKAFCILFEMFWDKAVEPEKWGK